jgi:DMSO/TMAO reductase YedYZ molybdopterin-dependent catalytic subunit
VSTSEASIQGQVGLIIRERDPVNLEYPYDQLQSFLTPNDLFYIRSHYQAPQLDQNSFRLSVSGAVRKPFMISYADLLTLPAVTRPATIECAGNGRIFLVPQVRGAQWQLGAVSTAEWTGVPLSSLLECAELNKEACEIVLEAADMGVPKEEPIPPGQTRYARSVSADIADNILIAYAMNGERLTVDHGFPLRAIVPGHYGMASVKWLTHIRAVDQRFNGYWQTSDYGYWDDENGHPVRRPLGPMAVKSAIARPRTREVIPAGSVYPVFGAAWSRDPITATEISTDNGGSWQPVQFLDEAQPFVWRRWAFEWQVPEETGVYILKSRATDAAGNTQPSEHDKRFGTYVIHHTLAIEVEVR